MRPKDLPDGSTRPHGTRSRYVSGCRCVRCRKANVDRYHARQRKAKIEALALPRVMVQGAPQTWTLPDGTQATRIYKRACPGVNGNACPNRSHLRRDSTGGICARCRELLIWNGLVSATRARNHLRVLSRAGVGRDTVNAACGVAASIIDKIRNGKKRKIRAETERALLSVDVHARNGDRQLVPAKPTQKRLNELLRRHGFTKTALARRLGSKAKVPALQFNRAFVTAQTEAKVRRLLDVINAGD